MKTISLPYHGIRGGLPSIVRLTALIGVVSCSGWLPLAARAEAPSDVKVLVETVAAKRGVIAQPVRAYGIVAATGASVTTISVHYAARLVRWRVARGQAVERGVPLFEVTADPAAVLAARQARSALDIAQRELGRTQSLYDSQLATRSQFDAAKKALDDAREADAAQRQLGVEAGIVTVAAPFAGAVMQIQAAQGDTLQPGAAVMQLVRGAAAQGDAANLELSVEPSDLPSLHAGDLVAVRSLAASGPRTAAQGRVVDIGAAIDSQTQLVPVTAAFALAGTGLLPGSHVVADILPLGEPHWIVPRLAVLSDDDGAFVFQLDPQLIAHRVAVEIRVEQGDSYGIDGPLNAAWPIVSTGNYELSDRAAVRLQEAHR